MNTKLIPKPQELKSMLLGDYNNRIIVAGSRGYNDRREFHSVMCEYIEQFTDPIIFLSGDASTGADRLIIDWCKKFEYPCLLFPAMWDNHKVEKGRKNPAGMIRNEEMAKVGTRLLAFYDRYSPGTANMIARAEYHKLIIKIINVQIVEEVC